MTSAAVNQSCQVAAEVAAAAAAAGVGVGVGVGLTLRKSAYEFAGCYAIPFPVTELRVHSWQFHFELQQAAGTTLEEMLDRLITCEGARGQSFATVQQYLLKVHNNMKS